MKRTKRKARYYQYGSDLTTMYNNAQSASIQAPSNTTGFGNTLNSGFNTSNQANTRSSGVDFSNMFGGDSSGFSPSGALGLAATAVGDIANVVTSFADSDDRLDAKYKNIEQDISNLANTQFKGSNASLAQQSTMLPGWNTLKRGEDIDLDGAWSGMKTEGVQMLKDIGEGAAIGSQLGGDAGGIGAIVGAFMHPVMNAFANIGKRKAVTRKTNQLNRLGRTAEEQMRSNFNYAVANTDTTNDLWRLQNMYNTNYAAFGGLLETNGSNWKTGASYIENGGTHEMNPNDGVQYGIASDGLPNLVEEGEVVIKTRDNAEGRPTYSDYVLSNRVKPTLDEIINANITKKPEKYEGKSWAEIYKDIAKKENIKETVNRQDTKDYLDSLHDRISKAQEESRLREQQEQIMAALKKATPEQQDILLQQAGYPNPLDEAVMAAQGGNIYIKPSKRGTFTAAAKKRGMGVQEFANKVLANKEDYSPTMVKKANFARNFGGHKHAIGDYIDLGSEIPSDEISIPYDNSKGFKYYNNGAYDTEYLDWLNSRDWLGRDRDVYKRLSDIYKKYTGKTLTPVEATRLGQDKKFGPFHRAYAKEFEDRIQEIPATAPINNTPIVEAPENILPTYIQINDDGTFTELPEPGFEERISMGDIDPLLKNFTPEEGKNYKFYFPESSFPEVEEEQREIPNNEERELAKQVRREQRREKAKEIINGLANNRQSIGNEWLLPAISGATVLGDALGITNIPDYSNADRYGRAILPPTLIGYNPKGRYVKPLLTDPRYVSSRLANQSNAAIAAARDLSGSNRATALANIALDNYLNNQAIGQSLAQTDAANNAAIREAVKMNNEVDRANAQGMLTADQANQSELERYAARYAHQKNLEAQLREQIDNQVSANRSANWNNFLENLQGYFDNQRNRNMANESHGRIYGYTNANNGSGHILYGENKKKKKTKKNKR